MGDRMFSRPGETPSPGDHASLVCENHGKTQEHKSLLPGRVCRDFHLFTQNKNRSLTATATVENTGAEYKGQGRPDGRRDVLPPGRHSIMGPWCVRTTRGHRNISLSRPGDSASVSPDRERVSVSPDQETQQVSPDRETIHDFHLVTENQNHYLTSTTTVENLGAEYEGQGIPDGRPQT